MTKTWRKYSRGTRVHVVCDVLLLPSGSNSKSYEILNAKRTRISYKNRYHKTKVIPIKWLCGRMHESILYMFILYIRCTYLFLLHGWEKTYLGQCEAGFWNGQSCSTVVSHVTAWTEQLKPKQMNPFEDKRPIHGKNTNQKGALTCYFGHREGISRMIFAADEKEMSVICLWTLAPM